MSHVKRKNRKVQTVVCFRPWTFDLRPGNQAAIPAQWTIIPLHMYGVEGDNGV